MFKIFKYIGYAFQAKRGLENPGELVSDISFGPVQLFFILSFIALGLITVLVGFLGIHFDSIIFLILSFLFLMVLIIDIWIYRRVKRFFTSLGKRVVDVSQSVYKKTTSKISHLE